MTKKRKVEDSELEKISGGATLRPVDNDLAAVDNGSDELESLSPEDGTVEIFDLSNDMLRPDRP